MMTLSGSLATQVLGFARNALLAHGLSRGDFGVAAALMVALQMLETSTDLATDRYIVNARNGTVARAIAACHGLMLVRGVVCAAALVCLAGPAATLFGVPHASAAFAVAALVPLLRGFSSLDARRQQRHLDNRGVALLEVIPQAAALACTLPAMWLWPTYEAAVALAICQAVIAMAASHLLARRPYRVRICRADVQDLVRFSGPLWIAGLPLALVVHGERGIVGAAMGMEALAGFAAAAMMVAAVSAVAARLGQALILPALVSARDSVAVTSVRLSLATDLSAIAGSAITAAAMIGGAAVMPLLFGSGYRDMGTVLGWLVLGASIRILQAPVSLLLMAADPTHVFPLAALARAAMLVPLAALAWSGAVLETVAMASALSELMSLAVFAIAARAHPGALRDVAIGCLWLAASVAVAQAFPGSGHMAALAGAVSAGAALSALGGLYLMARYRAMRVTVEPRVA
jgi:O-antigen/teichoic acid export membrane protein